MNGHSILTEDFVICVDKWDASYLRRPGSLPHFFFLTHLHADHIKGLTSTWSRLIYTSPLNAWLLPKRRNVKPFLLKELHLNVTHTIHSGSGGAAFQVTLLDANHCPGAVMFLFQGSFGNILYTGDFRFYSDLFDSPILSPLIRKKEISTLYLDNTYAAATCEFPSRQDALEEVLQIIDKHPDHKIFIGMRQLGKEEVLRAIALHLNERVCVAPQRLEILQRLEYEDVFTVDTSQSRIHAVDLHTVTSSVCRDTGKVISIKLTSMYECANANLDRHRGNTYVVPYSDHSSHSELKYFVEKIRPLCIVPIVQAKLSTPGSSLGPWSKMSSINCVIPDSIWALCGPNSKLLSSPELSPPKGRLSVKFHPSPKDSTEDHSSGNMNVNHIDDGLNIVPFESGGTHFTFKNKARKLIKASWTRLAPKILSPKGISFNKVSPGKRKEESPERDLSCPVSNVQQELLNIEGKGSQDGKLPAPEPLLDTTDEGSIEEVDLSGDDDFIDMPSSARDLRRRMQLSTKVIMTNGMRGDNRLDFLPEGTQKVSDHLTRRRCSDGNIQVRKRELAKQGQNIPDDSSSVASFRRVTRKTASGKAEIDCRVDPEVIEIDSPESGSSQKLHKATSSQILTRRSLKEAYGKDASIDSLPEGVLLRSESKDSLSKSSLGKKSNSPETITKMTTSRESTLSKVETRRTSPRMENKSLKRSDDDKESVGKKQDKGEKEGFLKRPQNKDLSLKEPKATLLNKNESPSKETEATISNAEASKAVGSGTGKDGAKILEKSREAFNKQSKSETVTSLKEHESGLDGKTAFLFNGASTLSGINGIRMGSSGRKLINCNWEVAQELVRKETEQALMALDVLNKEKRQKLRRPVNPIDVKQRRMSADSALQMSKIINAATSSPPIKPNMRLRTASILNSMASTFQTGSSQAETVSKKKSEPKQRSASIDEPSIPSKLTHVTKKIEILKHFTEQDHDQPDGKLSIPIHEQSSKTTPTQKKSSGICSEVTQIVLPQNAPVVNISRYCSAISEIKTPDKKTSEELGLRNQLNHESQVQDQPLPPEKEQQLLVATEEEVKSQFLNPLNLVQDLKKNNGSNESLFLPESNLVSAAELTNITKDWMRIPNKSPKNSLNVGLMRLKVDFAMTTAKKVQRTFASTRIAAPLRHQSALQSKEKVQAWKNKISLRLTKSPHRRYRHRALTKARLIERSLISRSPKRILSTSLNQSFQGDVEDPELDVTSEGGPSGGVELFEGNSDYFADVESVYDKAQESRTSRSTSKSLDAVSDNKLPEMRNPNNSDSFVPSTSPQLDDNLLRLKEENAVEQPKNDNKGTESTRRSLRLHKDESLSVETEVSHLNSKKPLLGNTSVNVEPLPQKMITQFKNPEVSHGSNSGKDKVISQMSFEIKKSSLVSCTKKPTENPRKDSAHPMISVGDSNSASNSKDSTPRSSPLKVFPHPRGNVKDGADLESSNLLSLMADAFKNSVPVDKSNSTVNILSSMANNFNNFEHRSQIPASLSIQLTSSKHGSKLPRTARDAEQRDWSIEIVPISDANPQTKCSVPLKWNSKTETRLALSKLTGIKTPDSLRIELLPGQSSSEIPVGWREPSHPSVSISMDSSLDVIDLTDENESKSALGSPIQSFTSQAGSHLEQSISRRKIKQPEVQPVPESVWRERRDGGQGGTNVININIETQETEPQIPHCPVHCNCAVPSLQDPCFGSANNIRDQESDRLFEVPLSPEDFESSGAMIALGKSWLESCFDNPEDLEEFFQSHEGYLQIFDNSRKHISKHLPSTQTSISVLNQVRPVAQSSPQPNVASSSGLQAPSSCNESVVLETGKDPKPQKRSSTDSERSESLLREIERKIRAYNDQQAKKQTEGKSSLKRRMSLDSSSSLQSASKKASHSKCSSQVSSVKETTKKKSSAGGRGTHHSPSSEIEPKKQRLTEVERLTEAGKSASNQRYRLSVRRSLDHLMTRQKLRSDKRVKKPNPIHF